MFGPKSMVLIIDHIMYNTPFDITKIIDYSEPPSSKSTLEYNAFLIEYDRIFRFNSPYGVGCIKNCRFKTYREIVEDIRAVEKKMNGKVDKLIFSGGYMTIDKSFW